MAINVDKSFDVREFGIAIRDDDGDILYYITAGAGEPYGFQAPVNSIYHQDIGSVWKKVGSGVNDWEVTTQGLNQLLTNAAGIIFNNDGGFVVV